MSEEFEELPFDDQEDEREESRSEDQSSGGVVSLFFENTIGPGSRKEKLEVDLNMPVKEVKYTLSQLFSIPSDEFHLVFEGVTCDSDDLLSNYNIRQGASLLLIPMTTAG